VGEYDREVNQTGKQGRFHFQEAAPENGRDTTLEFYIVYQNAEGVEVAPGVHFPRRYACRIVSMSTFCGSFLSCFFSGLKFVPLLAALDKLDHRTARQDYCARHSPRSCSVRSAARVLFATCTIAVATAPLFPARLRQIRDHIAVGRAIPEGDVLMCCV
jgi:hypothetical protein